MRWNSVFASLVALLGTVIASTQYRDPDTGLTFASDNFSYKIGKTGTFRIAIPASIPQGSGYDVVYQVVLPNEIGWFGIAWNNRMIYGPLTVAWGNGNSAVLSARYTTTYSPPSIDSTRARLELIAKGTKRNGTHWQYTAKCSGCSSFLSTNNQNRTLNPRGQNQLAYAWSTGKPSGTSPSATIGVHDNFGYINPGVDFSMGANSNWSW